MIAIVAEVFWRYTCSSKKCAKLMDALPVDLSETLTAQTDRCTASHTKHLKW